MSIDLSRVTGISDSHGAITEIKDSLGRVLWRAVRFVTVTITGSGSGTYSYVVIDGSIHTKADTISVKSGGIIRCVVKYAGGFDDAYIQINGNIVAAAGLKQTVVTYDYTISGNATIQLVYVSTASGITGRIIITEQ